MITGTPAFKVLGDPIQQGSMTCKSKHAPGFKANLQPDNEKVLKAWRGLVVAAAVRWVGEKASEYQPVALAVTYSLARPAYHYGTGRNAGRLKPGYETTFPTKFGTRDMDKLERAIFDSLQAAGTLHNDAQVCDVMHKKRFVRGDPAVPKPDAGDVLPVPGVVIRIYPLGDDDV